MGILSLRKGSSLAYVTGSPRARSRGSYASIETVSVPRLCWLPTRTDFLFQGVKRLSGSPPRLRALPFLLRGTLWACLSHEPIPEPIPVSTSIRYLDWKYSAWYIPRDRGAHAETLPGLGWRAGAVLENKRCYAGRRKKKKTPHESHKEGTGGRNRLPKGSLSEKPWRKSCRCRER